MEVLQWNCNGAIRHLEDLKLLIHDLNPAIICLQETNFTNKNMLRLRGYQCFPLNRTGAARASGGVATYVRDSWEAEEIPIHNTDNIEIIVTKITAPLKITIANVYLPNSLPAPWESLTKILKNLPNNTLTVGDFNAHNPLWGSTHTCPRGLKVEKIIDELALLPLNTGTHTHYNIASNSTSAIDLSLSHSKYHHRFGWEVLSDECASDHHPIVIHYSDASHTANLHEDTHPISWKIKKATESNWDHFRTTTDRELELIIIPLHPTEEEINAIIHQVTDAIIAGADEAIGKNTVTHKKKAVPWWNEECLNAKNAKNHAFNRWKKHSTEENKAALIQAKKEAKSTFSNARKTSWLAYVSSIHQGTPVNEVWRKIKKIEGNNSNFKIVSLTENDGTSTSDSSKIADLFAAHFSSSSASTNFHPDSRPASNLPPRSNNNINQAPYTDDCEILNGEFGANELLNVLSHQTGKSAGPDGVPAILYHKLSIKGKMKLLAIINSIWTNKLFPAIWSKAIVIPLAKPHKSKSQANNYRPISLTCTLCKTMERLINNRLQWFLEKNGLLDDRQYGFRKKRSTNDALHIIHSEACNAIVDNQILIAVCLDIQKAFDMAWRRRILHILQEYGISGNLLTFIHNFLQNRSMTVRCNGKTSRETPIQNGVPQGSVISTTLFLVAMSEIGQGIISPCKYVLYADDITLYCTGKCPTKTAKLLQSCLEKLWSWSLESGFRFSEAKSNFIVFSNKNIDSVTIELSLNRTIIQQVNVIRILGLWFDRKLNWRYHLTKLKSDCKTRLAVLKCLSHRTWGADKKSLLMTYQALIQSKMDYGSTIYQSAKPTLLNSLDPVFNTGMKIICGAFHTSPTAKVLFESHQLSPNERRKLLTVSYAAKCLESPSKGSSILCLQELNALPYSKKPSSPLPFTLIFKNTVDALNIQIPNLAPLVISDLPPWIIRQEETEIPITPANSFTNTVHKLKSTIKSQILTQRDADYNGIKMENRYAPTWDTLNRREQAVITRLRIGHTRLTHTHLITKENPPLCNTCDTQITVEHILNICTQHKNHLAPIIAGGHWSAIIADANKARDTLSYLRTTDLFDKL